MQSYAQVLRIRTATMNLGRRDSPAYNRLSQVESSLCLPHLDFAGACLQFAPRMPTAVLSAILMSWCFLLFLFAASALQHSHLLSVTHPGLASLPSPGLLMVFSHQLVFSPNTCPCWRQLTLLFLAVLTGTTLNLKLLLKKQNPAASMVAQW